MFGLLCQLNTKRKLWYKIMAINSSQAQVADQLKPHSFIATIVPSFNSHIIELKKETKEGCFQVCRLSHGLAVCVEKVVYEAYSYCTQYAIGSSHKICEIAQLIGIASTSVHLGRPLGRIPLLTTLVNTSGFSWAKKHQLQSLNMFTCVFG